MCRFCRPSLTLPPGRMGVVAASASDQQMTCAPLKFAL